MKQEFLLVCRDANAGVPHRETQYCLPFSLRHEARLYRDLAFPGELDRVAREVREDLAQPARVAPEVGRHVGGCRADEFEPLVVGAQGDGGGEVVEHGTQVEIEHFQVELARFDLGEVENVVDQPEQGLAA